MRNQHIIKLLSILVKCCAVKSSTWQIQPQRTDFNARNRSRVFWKRKKKALSGTVANSHFQNIKLGALL